MIDDITKARFWSKVDVLGPDECWEWKACRAKTGYGAFYLNGKVTTASRASLIIDGRSVPKGWHACHTCDNPPCVNPSHLWAGSAKENIDDMHRKGRGHYDKTNCCHKGHILEGKNVMFRPSAPNVRLCVTCDRAASKARADRKNRVTDLSPETPVYQRDLNRWLAELWEEQPDAREVFALNTTLLGREGEIRNG